MRTIASFLGFWLTMAVALAQSPVVKIDFDQAGRSPQEVNQVGYLPWVVSGGTTATRTEAGVTFTLSQAGPYGSSLGSNWYKAGIQASAQGKLVNDGVTVKDGNANDGGQIALRLSGLPAGTHTLLAFLNAVDNDIYTFSPIDVWVDSTLVEDNVPPTVRAATTAEAQAVYLTLTATAGQDVVVLFAADTSGNEDFKNVLLNGFELNTPNPAFQAESPVPAHNDEHVELQAGGLTLSWTPADSALAQQIYFGTDSQALALADTTAPEFLGVQPASNSRFEVANLYTGDTYYWRVDQVFANGLTRGNVWRFRPAQLAFPQAEGHGRYARGGRGGQVVVVTNLNDSGPGSFRAAITQDIGPRTIVFAVSGIIELQSRLTLSQDYVTVAGQTAPGKGITIRSAPFGVTGNDCVVQNLRVRLGSGRTFDGMGLTGANHSIIDHCSISWTIDEAFSSRGAKNITLQRTLISEALNVAGHQNYPPGTQHGYAASIGGDIGSFHHNLLAHNYGRNWSLAGGLDGNGAYAGRMDITNNVVYNWGERTTDGGAHQVNFVNNYYKPGAGTTHFFALTADNEGAGTGTQQYYFAGNVMPGRFDESNQAAGRRSTGVSVPFENFVDSAFFPSFVATQSARHAYKVVLSDVGCVQPMLDDHDLRMITETQDSTYSVVGSYTSKKGFPDDEADAGGYENYPEITRPVDWDSDLDGLPDWYEAIIGTNENSPTGDFSDANADPDRDGYTHLDDYLQWMDQPHFGTATGDALSINLQKLSRGFTEGVTYRVANAANGTYDLTGPLVSFTPTAEGLGSFDFTVTDAEGDSMTRQVNILYGYRITEVEEHLAPQVRVWPVPSEGEVFVALESGSPRATYRVFHLTGQEVLSGSLVAGRPEPLLLPGGGVYLLQINHQDSGAVLHQQKLVVW